MHEFYRVLKPAGRASLFEPIDVLMSLADPDEVDRQQPPGFRGDRGEHLLRRGRTDHQRCHPPQGRVLIGDPAVLGVQLGVVQRDSELAGRSPGTVSW